MRASRARLMLFSALRPSHRFAASSASRERMGGWRISNEDYEYDFAYDM